mgnify:CR=1 FL=1
MTKIYAIHSGGDWTDASAEYVVLPPVMDIKAEHVAYREWYENVFQKNRRIGYLAFNEWLLSRGAREPEESELEVIAPE